MANTDVIRLLSDDVINQIAAGEVASSPAVIVKELIDNALDSGATSVEVHIRNGGKSLIQVIDNGSGMGAGDLASCVKRHATSKIRDMNDLNNLTTMGFRGEALASIAAVSDLSVVSGAYEVGHQLTVKFGDAAPVRPHAFRQGTTVTVRDLLKNIPARQKFLRTDRAEALAVLMVMKEFGLARHNVSFKLTVDDKLSFSVQATDDEEARLIDVLGADLVNSGRFFTKEHDGVLMHGMLANVRNAKGASLAQHLFVNGRPVKDDLISDVLRSVSPASDKATDFVVFVKCAPHLYDVNTHPTKERVRFRDYSPFVVMADMIRGDRADTKPNKPLPFPENAQTYADGQVISHDGWAVVKSSGRLMLINEREAMKSLLVEAPKVALREVIILAGQKKAVFLKNVKFFESIGVKHESFDSESIIISEVPDRIREDVDEIIAIALNDGPLHEASLDRIRGSFLDGELNDARWAREIKAADLAKLWAKK